MSNKLSSLLMASGLVFALAGAARAGDVPSVTFNLGAASDYVFRGVSQTDEDPQVFGGADLAAGRFYAGAWASNVDFGDKTDAEIDLYAGYKPTLGPATLDLGVIYYGYVGAPGGADYGNAEVKVAAGVPVGKGGLGAAVFYTPDGFGTAEEATYYEVNGAYPLAKAISVSAALGRQTYAGPGDYTTWNLGGTWNFTDKLALDLRYHDTSEHDFGKLYDSRAVATLKAVF
ncbi:MAG: TorF family putative porin [Caulobacter sp.]